MPLISLMDTKQPGVNPGFICTHQKIGVVLILLFPLKLLLILLTLPNWSRHVFILVALACSYAGAYTVEHCRSACLMMNGTGDVPFSSKKITNNTIMTPSLQHNQGNQANQLSPTSSNHRSRGTNKQEERREWKQRHLHQGCKELNRRSERPACPVRHYILHGVSVATGRQMVN